MSHAVALAIHSQETITLLLGSRHAGQHCFKVEHYPITQVDSYRLQSLCDQGEREITWRRAGRAGRPSARAGVLSGGFSGGLFIDLVLKSEAPRFQKHVSCLVPLPLIQIPAVIAAELTRAGSSSWRVDLVPTPRSLTGPAEGAWTRLTGRQQSDCCLPLRHYRLRPESPAKIDAAWCATSIGFPCQTVTHDRDWSTCRVVLRSTRPQKS